MTLIRYEEITSEQFARLTGIAPVVYEMHPNGDARTIVISAQDEFGEEIAYAEIIIEANGLSRMTGAWIRRKGSAIGGRHVIE